ncbi:MAG TPA: DUF1194 domain-containing protein [Bauldia sp.]|nr:DUF1194 domain-containing protein [Bauldia sp.]
MKTWRSLPPVASLLAALVAASAAPRAGDAPTAVDLKLVLAVDISPSMSAREQRVQREGYVAAFRQTRLVDAVRGGAVGRIAVAYVEWAEFPAAVIPWTIVEDAESAGQFAARLESLPLRQELRTSLSRALLFSAALLQDPSLAAERSVIDISGDGPNNSGPTVLGARDAVVAAGIVINGLPIMLDKTGQGFFETRGLDDYYRDCVIGGAGAFALPVTRLDALAETIERKLLAEIAAAAIPLRRAAERRERPADCAIGERMGTPTAR